MDQKNHNWSFDVEAIPQDDALQQPASTKNATPVKVKIRMKKGDKKGVLRQGVISIPKLNPTTGDTEKIRVVHSDQTIMSFNMLMESDVNSKTYHKQHKFFHLFKSGKCLGTQNEDDDDPPYMLASPDPSTEIQSKRLLLEENQKTKLSDINFNSKSKKASTKAPIFLGKCKRGGCLDPPFSEDKYEYQPSTQQKQDLIENEKNRGVNSEKNDLNNSKITVKKSISVTKIECENTDIDSTLMLYKAESKKSSLLENHSDSIITYPPETSSESLGLSGKSIIRESSVVTNNSNNVTDTYFLPPKIMYQKNPDKNKDNNKINQIAEIRCCRQLEDITMPNNMKTSSLIQENDLLNCMSYTSGTREAITQPEYKPSQLLETTQYTTKNNQVKDPPTHEHTPINESDEIKSELRESINNIFGHLQQCNLKSLIVNDQKKSDVDTMNNELKVDILINSIDDTLVSENNTLHKYTGNVTKLKAIPTFENEVDNVLKHTISGNTIKSHSYKDFHTYLSPSDIVSTKDSIIENDSNIQENTNKSSLLSTNANPKNKDDSISNGMNNIHSNRKILADSDVIQKLSSGNVLSHSKLLEPITFDSVCDIHSTQSNSMLISKEDIDDKQFQNDFNEKKLSTPDLHPLNRNVSKQNDNSETALVTNLYGSKEKISKQFLDEFNKNTIQLHKLQSTVSNEMEYVEDLNKSDIVFNTHISYEKGNEYPVEDNNVINNAKIKVKQIDTDVDSTVGITIDITPKSLERLEIDNDENNSPPEIDNNTLIVINSNKTNENIIKNINNTKGENFEKPENKSIDNIYITEVSFSHTLEEKSKSHDSFMYNDEIKTTESEIRLVRQINGTTEPQKSSFSKINSTDLFLQNGDNKDAIILPTQVMKDENVDNKVEEDSILNQEVYTEKGKFLQYSYDSPNNNVFPFKTDTTSFTINNPFNTFETQNITNDHFVNDYKNDSTLQSREQGNSSESYSNHLFEESSGDEVFSKEQKLKLPSDLIRDKKEMSTVALLNSSTINSEIPKQPVSQSQYNGKESSYSSEKATDYSKTIIINQETKEIPISLEDNKLPQVPLQNVEAKAIIVDLAFQMYRNDSNETILKTFDVSREPKRLPHDSISMMKSILNVNDNNKMSLAINSEIQLCVEINKNNDYLYTEERALNMRESPNDDLEQYSYVEYNKQANVKNMQLLQKSLAVIYERNLVPLEKLIKNLVTEIDNIYKDRIILTKKKYIAPKKFKPLKSTYFQRCKCLKKSN